MRTAGLDDVVELAGLVVQGAAQLLERGQQVFLDGDQGRQMDGGRDDVVGGLAHVDVVVGVDGLLGADLAAHDLYGPVGDHLVGVHVGRGAAAGLEDVEDEGRIELTLDDLLGGRDDRVPEPLVQQAELVVDVGGLELDRAEGLHEPARLAQVAYGEVVQGAARLGAEEGVAGDLYLPHRVALHAVRGLLPGHEALPPDARTSRSYNCGRKQALYER